MLLRSEGIRQNRNELRAQDGNIAPVNLDEKQAQYSAWADRMQQEFEVHARNIKTQINMESVYGHISSGYRYIGRYTI
jgi:membrane-bound lytic murein transglycosylase B